MDKHSKKAIIVSVTFIFIILIIMLAMLINSFVNEYEKQQDIDFVFSQTTEDKVQENLENSTDINDLYIKKTISSI